MNQHNLIQGSPEWHAHRRQFFNASDAPAMMGCSPYETRTQLIHRLHTGISPEIDAATQRRFDDGHRYEALARPLAEEIIGLELYPVVGSEGKLSASFDGLTMCESMAFEHKSLNDALRAAMTPECTGADLPLAYRVQMEQQCMVSGAERVLFMASKWNGDELVEERHCWYESDQKLAAEISAGWAQLERDLTAYVPTSIAEMPKAEVTIGLPALFIHAKGEITTSNMKEYGTALAARLQEVRAIALVTDQDFSNAKESAKMLRENIEQAKLAKDAMLAQTVTVGEAARMIDAWCEDMRLTALQLEKDVEREDKAKKAKMILDAKGIYDKHIEALHAEITPLLLAVAAPVFSEAIKNKRSFASMQDAVDTMLANAKIAADAEAKDLRAKLAWIKEAAKDKGELFRDLKEIIRKPTDDFQLVVNTRLTEQKKKDDDAAAKVIKDEADRIAALAISAAPAPAAASIPVPAANVVQMPSPQAAATRILAARLPAAQPATPPTMKMGDINALLSPISLTADGLTKLGFPPAATDKSAKLYHARDLTNMCAALHELLDQVQARQAA